MIISIVDGAWRSFSDLAGALPVLLGHPVDRRRIVSSVAVLGYSGSPSSPTTGCPVAHLGLHPVELDDVVLPVLRAGTPRSPC
jgi:hypothetical protein